MLEKIAQVLSDRCLISPHARILVGVSGGPDSLCLMDVLHRLGYPISIAHFNHKLRTESDEEAHTVEMMAARLSVPFTMASGDVRQYARTERLSIEEAARNLRYKFLFAEARSFEAHAVAVGHTADDQVETVLMHLIRGAGLNGLSGMSYRTRLPGFDSSIPVIRPLLDAWRSEIAEYCKAHSLQPHYDASNESLDFFRNRVRQELIPRLQSYNPRFRETLLRTAQALSSDHELLDERLASDWKHALIRQTDDYIALDSARFTAASRGLQRHLIRLAIERLSPGAETNHAMLVRAVDTLGDGPSPRTDLTKGLILLREGDTVFVARGEEGLPTDAWPQMQESAPIVLISIPGRVTIGKGWQLDAELSTAYDVQGDRWGQNPDPFRAWLDAASLPRDLVLRTRRKGDRFKPFGLKGHSQKLSDFFVNEKLPARARNQWPILCAGDSIIWVPGYRISENHGLREGTEQVVILSLSRVNPAVSR